MRVFIDWYFMWQARRYIAAADALWFKSAREYPDKAIVDTPYIAAYNELLQVARHYLKKAGRGPMAVEDRARAKTILTKQEAENDDY